MFYKTGAISQNEKGFTIIEMLIVVAAISILGLAAAATTYQVINVTGLTNTRMVAVKQVENAASWLNQDGQMARTVQVSGDSGFPLTLSWTEWNNTTHQVVYLIQNNQLKRSHSLNSAAPTVTVAANYVDPGLGMTNCQYAEGIITCKLTATVGGFRTSTETRTFSILPRPS
jgi:prepilin-type N-terminal cleavage/methylation domain-containing protein